MPRLPAVYDALTTERFIEDEIFPYVSRKIYTVSELTAEFAARYPYRKVIVDGAGDRLEAMSNGTAFYYMDGTAV